MKNSTQKTLNQRLQKAIWIIALIMASLAFTQANATIRRVSLIGAAPYNGTSWANAYTSLQSAINASVASDEVWIAAGNYSPASGVYSFFMKNGVKVYGGFNTTMTALSQRDWKANVVKLVGTLNGPVVDNTTSFISSTSVLDGVTITGGRATYGGGMKNGNYNGNPCSPTLTNVIFDNNQSIVDGGGMWTADGSPKLTNVIFINNKAGLNQDGSGAGMYNDEAAPILVNVAFINNTATASAGAVENYNGSDQSRKPTFTNCLFIGNRANAGVGGAVWNYLSSPTFTNCTFTNNYCFLSAGGGIHDYSPSGTTTANQPKPKIINCVFWKNRTGATDDDSLQDVGDLRAPDPVISYSYFKETVKYGGTSIIKSTTDPFVNLANPIGTDNVWLTADDGLHLKLCIGLIDRGDNNVIDQATDITASIARNLDNPMVTNAGAGSGLPVDLGAYEDSSTATPARLVGTITNAHMIPVPQHLTLDSVRAGVAPVAGIYNWQKSENGGGTWSNITGNQLFYQLPAITTTTLFRRGVTSVDYCNTTYYSDPVTITAVYPNGYVTGTVWSRNHIAVKGIAIKLVRNGGAISGSPAGYSYYDTTDDNGRYNMDKVYYGDPNSGSASFTITAIKAGHRITPSPQIVNLSYSQANISQDFVDSTVFSLTGTTWQKCVGCNDPLTLAVQTQTCPLDSVSIYKNGGYYGMSNFNGTLYGRYAMSIEDPSQVIIKPVYNTHKFAPSADTLLVNDNMNGRDFTDTTTHEIRGRFMAGCNESIGRAILQFTDTLPNDANNNLRTCFNKLDTTDVNGYYDIRLPARRYKVSIKEFLPTITNTADEAYIFPTTLKNFINQKLGNALYRDITNKDTTLNIVYERPPALQVIGLNNVCGKDFTIMQQGVLDSFTLKVFQGSPTLMNGQGCPAVDTSLVRIVTSVPSNDNSNFDTTYKRDNTGVLKVKMRAGAPFIISPYQKPFNVTYTDRYGRDAVQLNKKVIVTGVQTNSASFFTVSPQVPLLILHDPPGDGSFSTWLSTQTMQTAMRFYTASSSNTGAWLEAKIGTDIITGIGVSTESKVWGLIDDHVTIGGASTTSNEAIVTTSTSQSYQTSALPIEIGGQGDLYIGAAINIKYAKAFEVKYNSNSCLVSTDTTFMIAPNGFKTDYVYTEANIRNNIIPNLREASLNTNLTQYERDSLGGQITVWEEVMANNAKNKEKAVFEKNISFNGGGSITSSQTSSSVSNTNTIEFTMNIDNTVAAELGFEVAGNGVRGGVSVNCKIETGNSTSTTITKETTIGYTLTDDDAGDQFTVNVKKDPVYATPVFEMVAGQASCPPEENMLKRDGSELVIPTPIRTNVVATDPAVFQLQIVNTSPTGEARGFVLAVDPSSNPNGAVITMQGLTVQSISFPSLPNASTTTVTVSVYKGPNAFSYEGLKFILSDACTGDVVKTGYISAFFVSPCSSVTLAEPDNGWLINSASNNHMQVLVKDYNVAGLTNITLEYAKAGYSNWVPAATVSAASLNPIASDGTYIDWNVASVPDTLYNIRLKLLCAQGIVYSMRSSGSIDRKAPVLVGTPEPTDDVYVNGDLISFTYNEKLNTNDLNNGQATLLRMSNNTVVPVTVGGYENKIVITPNNNIAGFVGDSFRLIVKNISDAYSNVKTTPDTIYFRVGSDIVYTGPKVATLAITNPVVYKNGDSTINFLFKLNNDAVQDTRINYTIAGTAKLNVDYKISYDNGQPYYTYNNGALGSLNIASGTKQTILRIRPIGDSLLSPDKTITISLTQGGDYNMGSVISQSGKITSEDSIMVYTFIGNGNFNVKSNWLNAKMPLSVLAPGKEIIIDPSGVCNLNTPLTLKPTSKLTVKQNKVLIIPKSMKIN